MFRPVLTIFSGDVLYILYVSADILITIIVCLEYILVTRIVTKILTTLIM